MATLDFIGNPNIRNILFMAEPSGECIAVSTFCRKHNRRGRFLRRRRGLHVVVLLGDDDGRAAERAEEHGVADLFAAL